MYAEIRRRQGILAEARISTWGRLGYDAGPRVLGVFDEFSNLADALDSAGREQLWRYARMVAAEGRKAGVHLAIALQDPSHRSLDLRIRRNMVPVAFRVRDGDASRVILNAAGAEQLPNQQFLTLNGYDLVRGVAFAPDDDEIVEFLERRPAEKVLTAEWVEATAAPELNSGGEDTAKLAEMIRTLWSAGASKRAMARAAGGEYAGAFANKIDAAIRHLEGTTTTSRKPLKPYPIK
jgi:hypothetical protein